MLNSLDMALLKKVGVSQCYQGSGVSMFDNKSRSQPSLSLVLKQKRYPVQVHVYFFYSFILVFLPLPVLGLSDILVSQIFLSLFSGVMQPEERNYYSRGWVCHLYKYLLVYLYDN